MQYTILDSNNNIGNARISGIVLDPTRNSIQNKFNGTSNSNGIYSYSWTIPITIKSQTYQVKVNASTVDPVLYNLKPGVAVFSVNSLTSDSTTSHHHVVSSHRSSSNHHDQGRTDHSSSSNHHDQGSNLISAAAQIIMIKAVPDHRRVDHHDQGSTDHRSSSNHHDQGRTHHRRAQIIMIKAVLIIGSSSNHSSNNHSTSHHHGASASAD